MGKLNKKIKSDRINALRKQYDAFVEEDKKRKERNEYILGILDKMRFSTTAVSVRQMVKPSINPPAACLQYQTKMAMSSNFQPSVVPKSQFISDKPKTDDLFAEISKNYILIPKIRSSLMSNYLQQAAGHDNAQNTDNFQHIREMQQTHSSSTANMILNSNENSDWKSKYEILNVLKKEEVGNQKVNFATDSAPASMMSNEMPFHNINEKTTSNVHEAIPNHKSNFENKCTDDLPEKDIPFEKTYNKLKDNEGVILNAVDDIVNEVHYKLQKTNLESNYIEDSGIVMLNTNRNYAEQEYNPQSTVSQALGEQKNYIEHVTVQAYNAESNVPQSLKEQVNYVEYAVTQGYNAESNGLQALEEQTKYVEYAAAQGYNSESKGFQVLEEQTDVEYAAAQTYNAEKNVPQSSEKQTNYVDYATEQEYGAQSTVPLALEKQHNYVDYAEKCSDANLLPDLNCSVQRVDTNANESFENEANYVLNSVNLAEYKSDDHIEAINSNELMTESNNGQTILDSASNDCIQYEAENVQVEELPHQLQGTVADDNGEWKALEIEQIHFGAMQQPSYDDVAQQQQAQFLDKSGRPHSTNEGIQIKKNTTENITEDQTSVDEAADIEAFDAEQREMFYSEDAADNNEQPLDDSRKYLQNGRYEEYQDYYYENEQTYNPINMGENEEEKQRYDPAYSQQYIDPYEQASINKTEIPNESYQQGEMEQTHQIEQEILETPVDSKDETEKQETTILRGYKKD